MNERVQIGFEIVGLTRMAGQIISDAFLRDARAAAIKHDAEVVCVSAYQKPGRAGVRVEMSCPDEAVRALDAVLSYSAHLLGGRACANGITGERTELESRQRDRKRDER